MTAAFSGVGAATAQTADGVGSSVASTSILSLQLGNDGSLLDLGLLVDKARSTIDSTVASAQSSTSLVPVALSSKAIPAVGALTGALPKFETLDPGGKKSDSGPAIDLANLGGVVGGITSVLPVSLLGGEVVPTKLTSELLNNVATSTLDTKIVDLNTLFGLLSVQSITNTLGTKAAAAQSDGIRGVKVGEISVLDLGNLLKGLGIDLNSLPLKTVSDLVTKLGIPVELLQGDANLLDAVGTLQSAIAGVTAVVDGGTLPSAVVNTVQPVTDILGTLPAVLPTNTASDIPTASLLDLPVSTTLATLTATLNNLLGTALDLLGDKPLLSLAGADVNIVTKATDNVTTSVADVTATVGGLEVLGLKVPGVNLLNVGATVNSVTGTLGSVLSIIDPALKDLVGISFLDKTSSVSTSNGYVRSVAGLDLLKLSIKPPALLGELVSTLTGNSAASSTGVLSGLGLPTGGLPVQGASATSLAGALNLPAAVGALVQGATLRVGSIQSSSDHIAAVAPGAPVVPADQQLPRTGSESTRMAFVALGLAALALGVRRFILRPTQG
ncbi:MAG: hypothetical protein ABIS21_03355 [Acidimicrobiales bacterium]